MARAGARALWSLSESRHNKEIMRTSGVVPLMARLLKSIHIDVVVPTMGTIQQCATQVGRKIEDFLRISKVLISRAIINWPLPMKG